MVSLIHAAVACLGRPKLALAHSTPAKSEFWKSVFVSSTHCAGGCVIGDIIGAPIVFAAGWTLFGERLYADYVVLFALAFIFGIAFQYLAIREVRRITPRMALVDALKADTPALSRRQPARLFKVQLTGEEASSRCHAPGRAIRSPTRQEPVTAPEPGRTFRPRSNGLRC
jgi:Domain of unknown function (DUF4396)